MAKGQGLSEVEIAWLIAWNAAAGYWSRVGLGPDEAKTLMGDFVREFAANLLEDAKRSQVQLQQALMALRKDSFEEIQDEAPFRPHAQGNMRRLVAAYVEGGDSGISKAWQEIFPEGWEEQPTKYEPIRITGGDGESSDHPVQVVGASDLETRVAAEWWYLRYRFGHGWEAGMHITTREDASGERFSVHSIRFSDGSRKQIFFQLPGSRKESAPRRPRDRNVSSSAAAFSDQPPAKQPQTDIAAVSDYVAKITKLPPNESAWLLGWIIAAGQWQRIGLKPAAAKELLGDLFGRLRGDPADLSKRSAERLQHKLMALRIGSFEEIQQEAPFSRFAQRNVQALLQAWRDRGEPGFAQVWDATFRPGWEDEGGRQYPIRIISKTGNTGDSEQSAIEIFGPRNRQSEAEFWHLFYTFGEDWNWERHETVGEGGGPQFSVHHIRVLPDSDRRVYFRRSW
jgi:hypothetical protein